MRTPEHRLNPKLVHFVDQDHEIVTENLRQRFVDLGRGRLAAERIAKLGNPRRAAEARWARNHRGRSAERKAPTLARHLPSGARALPHPKGRDGRNHCRRPALLFGGRTTPALYFRGVDGVDDADFIQKRRAFECAAGHGKDGCSIVLCQADNSVRTRRGGCGTCCRCCASPSRLDGAAASSATR